MILSGNHGMANGIPIIGRESGPSTAFKGAQRNYVGIFMPRPRLLAIALICLSSVFAGAARAGAEPDRARDEIRQAIEAMGGETVLRSVHSLQFSAVGHRNMLEQSLRPEGPWWQDYVELTEIRDFQGQRERVSALHRGYSSPEWWLRHESWDGDPYYPTFVVTDSAVAKISYGKFTRFSSSHLQDAEEDLACDPIQLLLTALASPDLHSEPDRSIHGFTHHMVTWAWNGTPVHLTPERVYGIAGARGMDACSAL